MADDEQTTRANLLADMHESRSPAPLFDLTFNEIEPYLIASLDLNAEIHYLHKCSCAVCTDIRSPI